MLVFSLIKSLTKAEKRNFKLFCSPSLEVMYVQLYDILESMDHYDEKEIIKKLKNISKQQLHSLKTQLYKQILKSLAQLQANQNPIAQIRQASDFANALIDRGFINQAFKILVKTKAEALKYECYTLALEIVEQLRNIELIYLVRNDDAQILGDEAYEISQKISRINAMANLSIQFSNLSLKLGYARSEKDKTLIITYFQKRLNLLGREGMCFLEKMYFYQCNTWYYLIQYDFVNAYKWCQRWVSVFDQNEMFKTIQFDHYIRANSRLLDTLFMTRRLSKMKAIVEKLENEKELFFPSNLKTQQSFQLAIIFAKVNTHFLEGTFKEGVKQVPEIEEFIQQNGDLLHQHFKMLLNYKIACLHFGCQDYKNCIKYLERIIAVKDPKFRRDLQVFARILNLIASYEIGNDETLDRQIKAVYSFVLKTNDMHEVQKAIIQFLKSLPYSYASNFKNELIILYKQLKPLESDPYKRRPFFYLDIISWLESKIYNEPISEIRKKKLVLR